MPVTLTDKQAELILWACKAGLEQHQKFVRHDDWDCGMTKAQRYKQMWADRKFKKAITVLKNKSLRR